MQVHTIKLTIIDAKIINEGVIFLKVYIYFQFQADVIISDLLSIGGILILHDLIQLCKEEELLIKTLALFGMIFYTE